MKRLTLFTFTIEDLNEIDHALAIVYWAKDKIREIVPVLSEGDCCREDLNVVALRLEQAYDKGNKALFDER